MVSSLPVKIIAILIKPCKFEWMPHQAMSSELVKCLQTTQITTSSIEKKRYNYIAVKTRSEEIGERPPVKPNRHDVVR